MVDPILLQSWQQTRRLLADALAALPSGHQATLAAYQDWLDNNELELAMDELEIVGDAVSAPPDFYACLARAAANMNLVMREAQLRDRAGA